MSLGAKVALTVLLVGISLAGVVTSLIKYRNIILFALILDAAVAAGVAWAITELWSQP